MTRKPQIRYVAVSTVVFFIMQLTTFSAPPASTWPMQIENGGNGVVGSTYKIHFYVTYDNVVLIDEVFMPGQQPQQRFNAPRKMAKGKTFLMKVEQIRIADGVVTQTDTECDTCSFDGGYPLTSVQVGMHGQNGCFRRKVNYMVHRNTTPSDSAAGELYISLTQ